MVTLLIISLIVYIIFSKKKSIRVAAILITSLIIGSITEYDRQKKYSENESLHSYFVNEVDITQKENLDSLRAVLNDYDNAKGKTKLIDKRTNVELNKSQIRRQKELLKSLDEIEIDKNNEKYKYSLLYDQSINSTIMEIKKRTDWIGIPSQTFQVIKMKFNYFVNYFRGKDGENDNAIQESILIGKGVRASYIPTENRIFKSKINLNYGTFIDKHLEDSSDINLSKILLTSNEIKWVKSDKQNNETQISLKSSFTFLLLSFLTSLIISLPFFLLSFVRFLFIRKENLKD